jgi:hypothetical protein
MVVAATTGGRNGGGSNGGGSNGGGWRPAGTVKRQKRQQKK